MPSFCLAPFLPVGSSRPKLWSLGGEGRWAPGMEEASSLPRWPYWGFNGSDFTDHRGKRGDSTRGAGAGIWIKAA